MSAWRLDHYNNNNNNNNNNKFYLAEAENRTITKQAVVPKHNKPRPHVAQI